MLGDAIRRDLVRQPLTQLLDTALELPAEDRERWIESLPQEHSALKPRLRALLARAGEFLPIGAARQPRPQAAMPHAPFSLLEVEIGAMFGRHAAFSCEGAHRLARLARRGTDVAKRWP